MASFHVSCIGDAFSSLLSDLNALHENFAMNLEDVNRCLPVRKWGAKVQVLWFTQTAAEVGKLLPGSNERKNWWSSLWFIPKVNGHARSSFAARTKQLAHSKLIAVGST